MKRIFLASILFLLMIPTVLFANTPNGYDVIVVGSDPEGITAAVSAAREGAKVLLVDKRDYLGGLYTSGMLTMLDMNYRKANSFEVVNNGFFSEFYAATADNTSIDVEHTKQYFANLLRNNNVTTILGVSDVAPQMEGNKITGVWATKNSIVTFIPAKVVIDASQDAQLARQAGATYVLGREDLGVKGEYAAATLVFSVNGVDWSAVMNYLNSDNSIYTGANEGVAWGYEQMLQYVPSSTRIQLRRLNISRQRDGSVVINALQIFGVDSLDKASKAEAYRLASAELPRIIQFLRASAPGFENASLGKAADELYIREGVRIIGENTLTSEDVFTNKDYPNKIGYGSYPTDLQSTKRDFSGGNILTGRNIYTLPFGIMIPKGLEGLFVVGRSASYDSIAHSSARTVPVGMALGQAAGVGAAYSINNQVSLKDMNDSALHISNIQTRLHQVGVDLDLPLVTNHPEKEVWAYPYIQRLRSQGFLSKERNYVNDYYCYEAATVDTVNRIITLIRQNSNLPLGPVILNPVLNTRLTKADVLSIVGQMVGNTSYNSLSLLREQGIIDTTVESSMANIDIFTNAHIYALMDNVVSYLRVTNNMPIPTLEEITKKD